MYIFMLNTLGCIYVCVCVCVFLILLGEVPPYARQVSKACLLIPLIPIGLSYQFLSWD